MIGQHLWSIIHHRCGKIANKATLRRKGQTRLQDAMQNGTEKDVSSRVSSLL
jgi:hypothetical protein